MQDNEKLHAREAANAAVASQISWPRGDRESKVVDTGIDELRLSSVWEDKVRALEAWGAHSAISPGAGKAPEVPACYSRSAPSLLAASESRKLRPEEACKLNFWSIDKEQDNGHLS